MLILQPFVQAERDVELEQDDKKYGDPGSEGSQGWEEVSISYIDYLYESRSARHRCCDFLGFVCKCEICREPEDSLPRRKQAAWVEKYRDTGKEQFAAKLGCVVKIEKYAIECGLVTDEMCWW